MKRRVVVTGMSAICPAGLNVDTFWDTVKNGKNKVSRITSFDTEKHESHAAAQIKGFDIKDYGFPFMLTRQLDMFCKYAMAATKELIENSKINLDKVDKNRIGIYVGNCLGGVGFGERELYNLYKEGWRGVSQFQATAWFYAAIQGQVSIYYKLKGISKSYVVDRISSDVSIGEAMRSILLGRLDCAIAGGSEAGLYPYGFVGFGKSNVLTKERTDPARGYKPYCIDSDGVAMSEGAGFVFLEELEHAKQRNAPIYAEVVAQVNTSDGYHYEKSDTSSDSLERAIRKCLEKAEVETHQIQFVNLDGIAKKEDDIREIKALKRVFGKGIESVYMSCPKVCYGHAFGAAGVLDVITNCLVINNNVIPPTINCENIRREQGVNIVIDKNIKADVNNTLQIASGKGGLSSAMLIKKYE